MADFATALRSRLTSLAAGTNVHWGIVPQGTALPYIRLSVASDPRPEDLEGYEGSRVTRIQADCFAATYGAARSLAEQVISAVAEPATVGTIKFGRTKAEGPIDLGEETSTGYVHRMSVDLLAEHMLA